MSYINEYSIFALSLALVALSLSFVFCKALDGISRNTDSANSILRTSIIGATLIEMAAMFILIVFFLAKR